MAKLINILVESTLWLGLFYLTYQLLLRKIKWPEFNRIFLLAGLLAAVVLPWLHLNWWKSASQPVIINVGEVIQQSSQSLLPANISSSTVSSQFNWFIISYLIVSGILLIQFIFTIAKLQLYWQNPDKIVVNIFAFSFFNFIYLNPAIKKLPNANLIDYHEKAHARQLHSLDVLILHIVRIFFWTNPFTWVYMKAIRENHEYLADEAVIKKYPRKLNEYQQQMLSIQLGMLSAPVNNFNVSPFKKRIDMINKNEIDIKGKVALLISTILFACSILACKGLMENVEKEPVAFFTTTFDQSTEADDVWSSFYHQLQRNLKYPAISRRNNIKGEFFVSFVIEETGSITEVNVNRAQSEEQLLKQVAVIGYMNKKADENPDSATEDETRKGKEAGEEALKDAIIQAVIESSPVKQFTQNGTPVSVKVELPIMWKLT